MKEQDLELIRVIETGRNERTFSVRASEIDEENLEIEFSFSSEEPVRRYFWETGEYGFEILDHSASSVRLDRLNAAGPLLKFHSRANWLGKVLRAWLAEPERKCRVRVKFHKSEAAEFEDVASGTKDTVSFGYAVHRMVLESVEGDEPTYRVVDWEPYEISLEPTPADVTVGPGRSLASNAAGEPRYRTEILGRPTRSSSTANPPSIERSETMAEPKEPATIVVREAEIENARREGADAARSSELERMAAIDAVAKKYEEKVPAVGRLAREAISQGLTVRQFEGMVGPILASTPTERFATQAEGAQDVGLSARELDNFRLTRLYAAHAFGDREPSIRKAAAFELEACAAAAEKRSGRIPANGFALPPEVLRSMPRGSSWARGAAIVGAPIYSRDMTAGGATTGADFVQTDVLGNSLIDFLRDLSVLLPRATLLRGLQGNVAIPRVTAGVAGAWVAEGSAPSETTPTLDQMLLSPKTIIAYVDVTRRLLLQSSIDVEAWLRREHGAAFAVTLENGGITDDGGSALRPEGLLGVSGTVQHDLGGGAGPMTWPHLVGFEANVELGAALDGDLAYITNPKMKADLKTISKDAGSGRFLMENGEANGYPVLSTNQVPSNLGGGSESAVIFGNLKEAVFGIWEEFAATVDPYSLANAGIVRITAQTEADFGVRRPSAFSVGENFTTTL